MTKFWELLEESVIVQSLLTVGVWGVIGYLVVAGKAIPDAFMAGGALILGYWFGVKTQNAVTRAVESAAAAAAERAARRQSGAAARPRSSSFGGSWRRLPRAAARRCEDDTAGTLPAGSRGDSHPGHG